jgi:hypothetical protein
MARDRVVIHALAAETTHAEIVGHITGMPAASLSGPPSVPTAKLVNTTGLLRPLP